MLKFEVATKLVSGVKKFLRREEGPTMVEYALMVALIAIVVAVAAQTLGTGISSMFVAIKNSLAADI